jgi:hypothetical protein
MGLIMQIWWGIQRTTPTLRHVNCGPRHIQCIYSSVYSGLSIKLNLYAMLFEISSTSECRLYYKLGAKYSAHPPVCAMYTMVPAMYNVVTSPHIQASIFNWTNLRCHSRHLDNSTRVILQTWCQIRRISSSLRYVNCGPGHVHCSYSSAYLGFNIQL